MKDDIETERLPPLVGSGIPLCSAQYERMYGTTRIPGVEAGTFYACSILPPSFAHSLLSRLSPSLFLSLSLTHPSSFLTSPPPPPPPPPPTVSLLDKLLHTVGSESDHIIVYKSGRWYTVNLYHKKKRLTPVELEWYVLYMYS